MQAPSQSHANSLHLKEQKTNKMKTLTSITIDIPSDLLLAINADEIELKQNIKISLAIHLYQQEKLTIGKAAQLAGLSRLEFDKLLSNNRIPISLLNKQDIEKDAEKLL